MSEAIGKKKWAFAAGCIPLVSTGDEPVFTSHDKVAILNTSDHEADIRITIFYEGDGPVIGYSLKVQARRIRKIRFNDLIDPLPVPLDKRFAFVLESDKKVIVQFSRMDTSSRSATGFCVTPFYDE